MVGILHIFSILWKNRGKFKRNEKVREQSRKGLNKKVRENFGNFERKKQKKNQKKVEIKLFEKYKSIGQKNQNWFKKIKK